MKYKRIKLTQNKYALVDIEDYEWLSEYKWYAMKMGHTYYATRNAYENGRCKSILMHREILHTPRDLLSDHKNRNGLDNRKSNLRSCTRSQNQHNRRPAHNGISRYKGVSLYKATGKWYARISINNKRIAIGHYIKEAEAAKAYDQKAKELFGNFAFLNYG